MGTNPKYVRTDFDHKLIGRHVQQYIEDNGGVIESAPPDFQHQNGVCERNWRTILTMARNWLASSLVPASFWWHAVKRAAEVSNYLPIKLNNTYVTPHELVFGQKPDFQNLFPMFCVSYVDYKDPHTLNIQTAKTIVIGRSDISHSLEFYHPHTKRILTSAVYRVDETLTAGPSFGLNYDGDFYFHKFVNTSQQYIASKLEPKEKVNVMINSKTERGTIITIPLHDNDIYTIQLADGSLHQFQEKEMSKIQPRLSGEPPLNTLPKWIHHLSKCTLFLDNMDKPKHGFLITKDDEFYFRPGQKTTNTPIHLEQFESNVMKLIETHQIFKGHPPFKTNILAKQNNSTSCISRRTFQFRCSNLT